MEQFEYKVVPAPTKGQKASGVRQAEDQFALSIETLMNELAQDGWQYQRSDTLPHTERSGWTGTKSTFRSMLVFRRAIETETAADPVPVEMPDQMDAKAPCDASHGENVESGPIPAVAPNPKPKRSVKPSIEGVVGLLGGQNDAEDDGTKSADGNNLAVK